MSWIELVLIVVKFLFTMVFILQILPLLIWAERKGAAYIQDRPGPNRASLWVPHPRDVPKLIGAWRNGTLHTFEWTPIVEIRAAGFLHTIVDVFKLITKEDVVPDHVEKALWAAAPVLAMTISLVTMMVVPWGDYLQIGDQRILLQVSQIDGGVLYVLAMTSLAVYAIMIAGWASNNKFSLLGGLRSSAQMVSYELAMGLSVACMFLFYGTTRLDQIVAMQNGSAHLAGVDLYVLPAWGVVSIPGFIAFVLFWVAAMAECNRTPFDLPEGEAELVAGYHTEYSSLRFALFFMAEYANMIVASAVTATLFFGGYALPFVTGEMIRAHTPLVLQVVGAGGFVFFLACAVVAFNRKDSSFNTSIRVTNANDPRLNEWKVFVVVWILVALLHAGFFAFGTIGAQWLQPGMIGPEIVTFITHMNVFAVKVLIGSWIFIWARWTLPRFRYDQLMNLGWKYMLPVAALNVLIAGAWIAVTGGAQ